MKKGVVYTFLISVFLMVAPIALAPLSANAQVLSEEIQRELARNNLTESEARELAAQLGIDLDDPVQASQRARELGVSETVIQRMLRAIEPQTPVMIEDLSIPDDSLLVQPPRLSLRSGQSESARARRDSIDAAQLSSFPDAVRDEELPFFGYDLFQNVPDAFQPDPVGPADDGYLVGPGDELRLTVWGAAEFQVVLPVDVEGRIFVKRVGQITVAGRRLSELREDVKRSLSRSYAGLVSDPETVFMDLTVTRLRPIKVFVLGEVGQPGGYTVASSSTLFNVLYSIGGPLRRGSLRNIDIIRNGKTVSTLDFYDYLLRGFAENPIQLRNNDFIFVRPRGITVAITGQVVRPAIYEMRDGETFSVLLDFAGGHTAAAYSKRYQIERIVPIGERSDPSIAREILDLSLSDALNGVEDVDLRDGDVISIFGISDRIKNSVTIAGAVFQPGRYQLTAAMITVRDLILSADGLMEEAFVGTASLVRVRDDFTDQQITLDLKGVLADEPTQNIPLMRHDSLTIHFRRDVQEIGEVTISGQVRSDTTISWRDNLRLSDLLFTGGGLYDSLYIKTVFMERADLFRINDDGITTRVIPFNLGHALSGRGVARDVLQPGDEIRIYSRDVERLTGDTVFITGAVQNPGTYPYRENLTLEDLILQAGGFTTSAYLQSADLSRNVYGEQRIAETISVPLLRGEFDRGQAVSEGVLSALFSARSVLLQPEDRVYVRTDPNLRPQETVLVSGEVRFPGLYTIEYENETLRSIVKRAGGLLPTGYSGGARLIRGTQPVIADFDLILAGNGRDIAVLPGDQLFIPKAPNTVEVRGNVNNPGLIIFNSGSRVKDYINRAGGLAPESADIFVTQADGATIKLRRGLFPTNPRVDDGGVILVTLKPPKVPGEGTDVGQIISDSISTLITLLPAIIIVASI